MSWISITFAGVITYLTRMTMIALISRDMLSKNVKQVLGYVASAVFPAIIFPGVFLNDYGTFVEINDPKLFGASIAILVGFYSKNIIATILSGLISYWIIIFIIL
tara:strand:+ start:71 stop:385 length:315 start_codon:yes stop_codon:yes gene_type:complete